MHTKVFIFNWLPDFLVSDMSHSVSGIDFCPFFRKIWRMISWNWIEQYSTRGPGSLTSVWILIPYCARPIHSEFKHSAESQRRAAYDLRFRVPCTVH